MNNQIVCFTNPRGIYNCFCDYDVDTNKFCSKFLFEVDMSGNNFVPKLGQNDKNYLFISSKEVALVSSLEEKLHCVKRPKLVERPSSFDLRKHLKRELLLS